MNRWGALVFAVSALIVTAGVPGMGPADSSAARPTTGAIYAGVGSGRVYRSVGGTSRWEEADRGLPGESAITALVATADGATLYAAAWGSGVYISTDAGMHWRAAGGGNPDRGVRYISGLALNPAHGQTIYAVTSDDRFHISTNGGGDWDSTPLPVDPIDSVTTTSLAVSRQDPAVMLVGTELEGIVRSTNGGRTWSDTSLLTNVSVNAIAFSPRSAAVAYAVTDQGIYRTVNGGISWQLARRGIPSGTQFQSIAVDPTHPAYIIAGSVAGRFYRSRDGGGSWSYQGQADGNQVNAILFNPAHEGAVFAGTNDAGAIYHSEDSGRHWSGYATGFDPNDEILALAAGG